MYQIFKDLKVIELASVLAGPSVGQFFAELGAKVIKIENPKTQGDVTRSWRLPSEKSTSSISAYFSSVNWGKESLALDITQKEDLAQLYELVEESDVVVASYKPLDAEKLKVDYETLKKIKPTIIYGHITGYGTDNPKVGYDAIIQAEAGFVYMNGEPKGQPVKMPVALMDILAAHQLKEALLIALLHLYKTQKGTYVSVSLLEAGVASLANQATNWLNAGHLPQRMGSEHPNIVPYGSVFETADSKLITLAVGTDKQFVKLCEILKIPEIAQLESYSTNPMRVRHKATLLPILRENIKKVEKEILLKDLAEAKVPAGGVNTLEEVFQIEAMKDILLESENLKGVRQFVAKFNENSWNSLDAPPEFG